jgi:hypothetical protein
MEGTLQDAFLAKLEEKYGTRNPITSRFGTSSFGDIASDLSISASQFSKLISGTATEGMYMRSIENIDRLLRRESIRKELEVVKTENIQVKKQLSAVHKSIKRRMIYTGLFGGILGFLVLFLVKDKLYTKPTFTENRSHPLAEFFDRDFNDEFQAPYVDISEIQNYCPCSAYEGEWTLKKPYKLPLPGTRKPGVYYLARSADVRMKCSRTDTLAQGSGRVLRGFEYLLNEIWVDTEMTPLSPTYFDKTNKVFTKAFDTLAFEDNPKFKKVANIHSFFIDEFELYHDRILRKGEPCGRYASDIDTKIAAEYDIDIKFILKNILSNLTSTSCDAAINPYCDPNDLKEGESFISFDCMYTIKTENLGIGGGYPYQKAYKLEKQIYTDNLTCNCE